MQKLIIQLLNLSAKEIKPMRNHYFLFFNFQDNLLQKKYLLDILGLKFLIIN